MNAILDWVLGNPKFITVLAGFVVALWTAIRKARQGKAARDALDLVNTQLREMGFTRPSVIAAATNALQARSRRKALLELGKSDVRLDTAATRRWRDEEVAKLKGKG